MSDLEGLKNSLIKKANEQGELKLKQAVREHEALYETRHAAMIEEKLLTRSRQLERVEQRFLRQEQQLHNQERQSLLKAKQDALTTLFDRAVERMNHWSEGEHYAFLQRVLRKYTDAPLSLTFGGLTRQTLTDARLEQLRQEFPNVQVENHVISQQGGFILTQGFVDDNYLYTTLVSAVRQEQNYHIASQIFAEA